MINNLLLLNFQSHKRSEFKFHPGVNVIIGESDAGKSAIMRAFKWLTKNRPQGDSFRSRWTSKEDHVVVKMWADDPRHMNDHASREIVKGEPIYHLGAQTFRAFKTEVPEELEAYFNMSDVNIQLQMDSPFLLSSSPGDVAKYFNDVARLSEIDTTLQSINSATHEIELTIGVEGKKDKPATGLIKQIADAKESLDRFDYLEQFEAEIEVLEEMEERFLRTTRSVTSIQNLIGAIKGLDESIKKESAMLEMEDDLNDIFSDMYDREQAELKYDALNQLFKEIESVQDLILQQKNMLNLEEPIIKLIELYKKEKEQLLEGNKLSSLIRSIKDINVSIERAEIRYNSLYNEFEDNFPQICPLCGKIYETPKMTK
jgi:DNA repair protein SbcC/Rad50